MHEYYASNKDRLRKGMDRFFPLVKPELEKAGGKEYAELLEETWDYYEKKPMRAKVPRIRCLCT